MDEVLEGRRFMVEPIIIGTGGHLCWFWSDDNDVSHAECRCPTGWTQDSTDAVWLVEAWREHYDSEDKGEGK